MKKYKIVPIDQLNEINYDLLFDESIESTRKNVSRTLAIVEFKFEVEDGLTNDEAIEYIENNWDDWNKTED